jgi:tetratricopeptide (TPR) repeat protein
MLGPLEVRAEGGAPAEALAVYGRARETLAEALGTDPSPELSALHTAVLRGEVGAAARPAPEAEVDGPPRTNLRAGLTSFVGRDAEIVQVGRLVGRHRLTTLTGPGGSGKTRLASETARTLLEQVTDEVWLVELAPVGNGAEVPQAVLATLRIREQALTGRTPTGEPVDRLASALRTRSALLVLDNCEHLVGAAAALADRLLGECPRLRILATSREPLGIVGEALWPVEPLGLPPRDAGVAEAMSYPSVRLLSDRAGAARPGFVVSERTAPAGWYWYLDWALSGRKAEGAELAAEALAMPGAVDDEVRATAFAISALFELNGLGDESRAKDWLATAERLAERTEHRHPVLRLVGALGRMAWDARTATAPVDAVDPLADEDPWVRATARLNRALTLVGTGRRHAEAEADFEAALAEFRALDERLGISSALTELAGLAEWRGDLAKAISCYEQAVAVVTEVVPGEDVWLMRLRLAQLRWLLGDTAGSAAAMARAERDTERIGLPDALVAVAYAKAELARWAGEPHTARNRGGQESRGTTRPDS